MATTLFAKRTVEDFDSWKNAYDTMVKSGLLQANGVSSTSVHHLSDDPNTIVVTHRFPNAQAARAHLAMLQAKQDEVGVAPGYAGPPEVWIADDVEQLTF